VSRAAVSGLLEVLKWEREHNCPWDSETCRAAAANGHTEVMQWALEHGCPEVPDDESEYNELEDDESEDDESQDDE
jgi:hypothetical protein